jgi:hypothetical protein
MDSPQELTDVDKEQETKASGLPSSNPSVLEADYANIRANLVEGSTPRRCMEAPALRVGLPCAGGQTSGRLVALAIDVLRAAPTPFAATSLVPRAPKVQIQLQLTSIFVHRCVRDEANACCLLLHLGCTSCLLLRAGCTSLPLLFACCHCLPFVVLACCCRCYLLVVLACGCQNYGQGDTMDWTDDYLTHICQLMVWLQLQLMCCFFLVDV